MATIALTGASGQLGRQTVEQLLARGAPAEDLVLITRSPERLAEYGALGASLRSGDFDEPASLDAAFAGVERLLLISTDDVGRRMPQHLAAIAAAARAGVGRLAYTSFIRPEAENPAFVAPEHRETEQALRDSGLTWTMLRNSVYAEFVVPPAEQALASGRIVTNHANGRTSYVSREDCAAAAAAVLLTAGHEHAVYDVTGPQALSQDDVAAILTELTGASIEVTQVDDRAIATALAEATGMPAARAESIATFGRAAREGWCETVSSAVETLTGRAPRTLREVLATAGVGSA